MHGPDKSTDRIVVNEGNDPTLKFAVRITTIETSGKRLSEPFPLDGFTAEFFIKAGPSTIDPAPVGIAIIPQAINPKDQVHVALTSAQLGSPGTRWCRLDVISPDNKRSTVHASEFEVRNV